MAQRLLQSLPNEKSSVGLLMLKMMGFDGRLIVLKGLIEVFAPQLVHGKGLVRFGHLFPTSFSSFRTFCPEVLELEWYCDGALFFNAFLPGLIPAFVFVLRDPACGRIVYSVLFSSKTSLDRNSSRIL